MGTPYISEIRIFAFNYAPKGWAMCNGQLMPINQNQALFSLLGTTYGGDGRFNFSLPNLQGRVPIHMGGGFTEGEMGGEAVHTLIIAELPTHNHIPVGLSTTGSNVSPASNLMANGSEPAYTDTQASVLNPQTITNLGGSQPHENWPPYIVLNFCIALQGIFPFRN